MNWGNASISKVASLLFKEEEEEEEDDFLGLLCVSNICLDTTVSISKHVSLLYELENVMVLEQMND
jgi:hypothetical protein